MDLKYKSSGPNIQDKNDLLCKRLDLLIRRNESLLEKFQQVNMEFVSRAYEDHLIELMDEKSFLGVFENNFKNVLEQVKTNIEALKQMQIEVEKDK